MRFTQVMVGEYLHVRTCSCTYFKAHYLLPLVHPSKGVLLVIVMETSATLFLSLMIAVAGVVDH